MRKPRIYKRNGFWTLVIDVGHIFYGFSTVAAVSHFVWLHRNSDAG